MKSLPPSCTGRMPFVAAIVCVLSLATLRVSHAELITQASQITSVDATITFNYPPREYEGVGPVQVGSEIGEDIVWNSSNPRAVANFTGYYGLGGNGFWQRDNGDGFIGVNRDDAAMLLKFNSGMVGEVGGFINYGPEIGWDAIIEAYDDNGTLLESYDLPYDAPISTPGEQNGGAFRGIKRPTDDIRYLLFYGAYLVADDVVFHRTGVTPDVPEPGALLTGVSLLGMTGLALRRRARR